MIFADTPGMHIKSPKTMNQGLKSLSSKLNR